VVGAEALYIAIKASFGPERARLTKAVEEMSRAGLWEGLSVEIVPGPDEYLFGEEKALLEVVSGGGPLPREPHYPPYELGPFGTPTSPDPAVVNNVETFAHVPSIVRAGADGFRLLGSSDTSGTLIFTLSGAVLRPGVYEREAGITLRELLYDVAGGPREGRRFKAALSGVASAVIPEGRFDTAADFGSLQLIGSGLGSAGFVVLDDESSVPRVAQAITRFLYVESCNQCTACKHGLRVASHSLDALFDPERATPDAIPRALYGARSAPQQNRCSLPVQGSVLIPSLLHRFEDEFAEQLANPARPSQPFLLPKMIDFDEASGTFVYDERQARKRPDWTFEPPAPPPAEARFSPVPAPLDAAPVTVRLAPDVIAALGRYFDGAQLPLDEQVNEALREWMRRRPPTTP
jgi:NADH-quinone oxidoreductase subunit F